MDHFCAVLCCHLSQWKQQWLWGDRVERVWLFWRFGQSGCSADRYNYSEKDKGSQRGERGTFAASLREQAGVSSHHPWACRTSVYVAYLYGEGGVLPFYEGSYWVGVGVGVLCRSGILLTPGVTWWCLWSRQVKKWAVTPRYEEDIPFFVWISEHRLILCAPERNIGILVFMASNTWSIICPDMHSPRDCVSRI